MKKRTTIFAGLVTLIILFFAFQLSNSKPRITSQINSHLSKIDTFDFDSEEFKKDMAQLREEIKAINKEKIKIEFDSETFKEEMKEFAVEMEKFRKEDFEFDSEGFKNKMKQLVREIKDHEVVLNNFEFDMSEFKEQMKELEEMMRDINIELKDIDIELGKLNDFMTELKTEMINDGLIDDENEKLNLKLNKDEVTVNGKRISDELFQKYIELYKDHFGKEPEEDVNIYIY